MAESGHELTAEERVLADRAHALAVPRRVEEDGQQSQEVVAFDVGAERYAVEMAFVKEVRPLDQGAFCRVPGAPPFVVGILNVRGRIHTVVDLGATFGLAPRPLGASAHVLVVATGGDGEAPRREVGVLSDAKPASVRIRGAGLRPPPETVDARARRFIRGVTEEMLVFLDLEKLLEDPGMIVQDGE